MAFSRDRQRSRSKKSNALHLEALEARTLMSTTPTGAVSVFNRTTISGWAYNSEDGGSAINVEITVNGSKTILTADELQDKAIKSTGSPYHGFSFSLPELPAGNSKVSIVAVSPTTGVRRTLKSGTLTNPLPKGAVTKITATEITGWAFDSDSANPIQVRVDIDGSQGTPFTTNVARNDLFAKYKVQNLGFDVIGDFSGHVVEVWALDASTGTPKLLYSNNKLPKGKVEINDGFTVSGWAQDPNSPTDTINVRVDIDGVTLSGTPTPANITRDDLVKSLKSADHGFSVAIPGLTPGKHTIAVYAMDGQASSAAPVLLSKKTVTNNAPVGKITTLNSTQLAGWALDPDMGASSATVNVYVDDTFFATVNADQSVPSLTAKYGKTIGANHGFTVDLSSLPPVSHSITVTAVDNRTSDQNEVVFFDDFLNNTVATGAFDTVTGTTIGGWAYDADAGADPVSVDLYVDGVYARTTLANGARSDVDVSLPSPNHAWSVALPQLSFGTHKIEAYAAESQGNVSVLIGSKTVVNKRPIGAIESANTTTITGWAADPDALGESVQVQVFINGVLMLGGPANVDRPDLLSKSPLKTFPGFSNYGFSVTLPELSIGRNQIDVFAVDMNNGMLSPLGSKVITVVASA